MPGTQSGGLQAAKTNKKLYGSNFYKTIGKMGGLKRAQSKIPFPFEVLSKNDPVAHKAFSAKGGKKSRRSR